MLFDYFSRMKKFYAILNTVVILAVIYWNYYSNTGAINGNSVGEISDKFDNLFTPAGYAFSIWGIIFLGLIVLAVNQIKLAFWGGKHEESILQIGPWLAVANVANGAWLWFWLHEQSGISVLIMLIILVSLLTVIVRLNMEKWDAPLRVIATVWWPICLYSGWIAVATIANISAHLGRLDWSPIFSEKVWTIIMICIAALVNLYMIFSRNMREFAAVGLWALIAIGVRHWGEIPILQWTAFFWAVIIFAAISWHGYKNRATNPFTRVDIP